MQAVLKRRDERRVHGAVSRYERLSGKQFGDDGDFEVSFRSWSHCVFTAFIVDGDVNWRERRRDFQKDGVA